MSVRLVRRKNHARSGMLADRPLAAALGSDQDSPGPLPPTSQMSSTHKVHPIQLPPYLVAAACALTATCSSALGFLVGTYLGKEQREHPHQQNPSGVGSSRTRKAGHTFGVRTVVGAIGMLGFMYVLCSQRWLLCCWLVWIGRYAGRFPCEEMASASIPILRVRSIRLMREGLG